MKKIEISLKEIMVYILNKWFFVLLSVCILGLSFGFSTIFAQLTSKNASNHQEEYQANINSNNARFQAVIDELVVNKENMQLSIQALEKASLNKNKGVVDRAVKILYDERVVDIYRVSNAYIEFFSKVPLDVIFSSITDGKYSDEFLRTFISVSIETTKGLPEIIKFRAIGSEKFSPNEALDILLNILVERNQEIAEEGGAHTLQVISNTSVDLINTEIIYREKVSKIRQAIVNVDANLEIAYSEIKSAINDNPSSTSSFIRNFAIGGLIGLILGMLILMLRYITIIPLVIPEQINYSIGLRFIGGYCNKSKGTSLSNALVGRFLLFDDEHIAIDYISTNLRQLVSQEDILLITGSLSNDTIQSFANELSSHEYWKNVKLLSAPDINSSVEGLKALEQASKVVLVERLNKSKLKDIIREVDRIEVSGKKLIGYVLY